MTEQTEDLELQIDETKASLVGKLEAIETQVAEVVQSTAETVSDTVSAVKESVETVKEKIHNAGQFFDLRRQAEQNPWMVFGGSVAAGCLASYLFSGNSRKSPGPEWGNDDRAEPESRSSNRQPAVSEEKPEHHSWFRDQLSNLSGLAIGTLMGVVRDVVSSNLPEGLGKSISQEFDDLTTRFGAQPISGPIIPPPEQPTPPQQPDLPPNGRVTSLPKQPAI